MDWFLYDRGIHHERVKYISVGNIHYLSILKPASFDFREEKLLKLYGPLLWMGFNCLKAAEPLQGDSLLFTTFYH